MLPVFGEFLGNIISNTYDLMNSFEIPGTSATPWELMMFIVRIALVAFALRTLFNWEMGVQQSSYRSWRKSMSKPSRNDGGNK